VTTEGAQDAAATSLMLPACTQAGKTTMLNCLAAAIPGGERVVSAEEVFELPNMRRLHLSSVTSVSA
jgi:Flp pilus assembly CpaF family ATPase